MKNLQKKSECNEVSKQVAARLWLTESTDLVATQCICDDRKIPFRNVAAIELPPVRHLCRSFWGAIDRKKEDFYFNPQKPNGSERKGKIQ